MCKHYNKILIKRDRHFVNAIDYNNCVLCLAENEGAMTQEEVAKYLGLSKMRICQIEHQALKKLNKSPKKILQFLD